MSWKCGSHLISSFFKMTHKMNPRLAAWKQLRVNLVIGHLLLLLTAIAFYFSVTANTIYVQIFVKFYHFSALLNSTIVWTQPEAEILCNSKKKQPTEECSEITKIGDNSNKYNRQLVMMTVDVGAGGNALPFSFNDTVENTIAMESSQNCWVQARKPLANLFIVSRLNEKIGSISRNPEEVREAITKGNQKI